MTQPQFTRTEVAQVRNKENQKCFLQGIWGVEPVENPWGPDLSEYIPGNELERKEEASLRCY